MANKRPNGEGTVRRGLTADGKVPSSLDIKKTESRYINLCLQRLRKS